MDHLLPPSAQRHDAGSTFSPTGRTAHESADRDSRSLGPRCRRRATRRCPHPQRPPGSSAANGPGGHGRARIGRPSRELPGRGRSPARLSGAGHLRLDHARVVGAPRGLIDLSAESACTGSRAACGGAGSSRAATTLRAALRAVLGRAAPGRQSTRTALSRTGIGQGSDFCRRTPIPSTRPFSRPSGRHQDRFASLRDGLRPVLTPTSRPYEPAATRR